MKRRLAILAIAGLSLAGCTKNPWGDASCESKPAPGQEICMVQNQPGNCMWIRTTKPADCDQ